MTTSRKLRAASVLVLGVALAAPVFAQDGPFIVNAIQAPATLDPAFACDIVDNGYVAPLYAPLVAYARTDVAGGPAGVSITAENDDEIVPALATSYEISEDGLTYTFSLRDGLKFASGNDLDGAAAAASLNRALTSGGCGTYYMEAANFGNTQSIVGEENTVTITLAKPEPLLIHALTQPNLSIVDVVEAEANGGNEWMANNAAGSGPYMLESYQPGVSATYVVNPNYYGDAPTEAEVVLNFVSDPSALLLQARNGGANVTLGLPKQMLAEVSGSMNVVAIPASRFLIVGLPTQVAPFNNATFRQALSYAVPYEAILDTVAYGYGESFFGPFPPQFSAYNAEIGAPRAFDMTRAQELLAESGVSGPVPLNIVIREGQGDQEQIATILQGAWSALGVEVTISKLSASAYGEVVTAPEKSDAILRFDGPSLADPAWLLNYDMRCESPYNMSNYCSETAENLLNEALAMPDLADRQANWDEIARIWVEDAPRIPLYGDIYTAVLSPDVAAFDFAQDGPFDIQNWGR